ncbi:MAG TPA: LysR family transcriptional regulator [Devosiaceae bacterium]|jgi:DNA-binding transcriptional LysR family regulator
MPVNLSAIDLNLMVVFNAIMDERNVSRAGQRLGMSQSATSNALNRLRHMLKDPLFVRSVEGMQPTAKAIELAGPVSEALHQFQTALEPELFEPDAMNWTFNIAISDLASVVLLPHLAPLLANTGVNVRFWPKINQLIPIQIDSNKVDFALGVVSSTSRRLERTLLFKDRYVCLMREGHPLSGGMSAEQFLAADHLAVRSSGDTGNLFDAWLNTLGQNRRVSMTVSQYLAVPEIVRHSDLLISVFSRSAPYLCQHGGLVARELPFDFIEAEIVLAWNATLTNLQSHKWMRRIVVEAANQIDDELPLP